MTTPTTTPVPPQRSSYFSGSVANMIWSMLVMVGIVLALVLMVPRPNAVTQPAVDVGASAREVARTTGWPILQPTGLPDGWKATSVRYVRSTDDLMTWHAGYQSPDGNYVAVEQTMDSTWHWVEAQTNRSAKVGAVEAGGRTWVSYDRGDSKLQRSLLNRPDGKGQLTTLITGTGTFEELAFFAGTLQPAAPQ